MKLRLIKINKYEPSKAEVTILEARSMKKVAADLFDLKNWEEVEIAYSITKEEDISNNEVHLSKNCIRFEGCEFAWRIEKTGEKDV